MSVYMTNYSNNITSMKNLNFDELTTPQIKELIKLNKCTNEDVANYYNNEWWDQESEF